MHPTFHPVRDLLRVAADWRAARSAQSADAPVHLHPHEVAEHVVALEREFDSLLARWVPDLGLREAWHRYLRDGGAPPESPPKLGTPLFRGRSASGSVLELRLDVTDGVRVTVDGAPAHLDPGSSLLHAAVSPPMVGGVEFQEVTLAPIEGVGVLGAHQSAPDAPSVWPWARALLEDGLIDRDFRLTERGHRLLSHRGATHGGIETHPHRGA